MKAGDLSLQEQKKLRRVYDNKVRAECVEIATLLRNNGVDAFLEQTMDYWWVGVLPEQELRAADIVWGGLED